MKRRVRYKTFELSSMDQAVYAKLPVHPLWSHVEFKIDFSFANALCSALYTGMGPQPYPPALKLKIHLVQSYYQLSDRQTEEKIIGDLFVKRFLGVPVDFIGFDHSTIGLDRQRMGVGLVHACHLYILAQMRAHGLWGHRGEQWLIDSFPSHAAVVICGAHRLIRQGMLRIYQYLKQAVPPIFQLACRYLFPDVLARRLSATDSESERALAFSRLAAQAYGLLHWLRTPQVVGAFERENKPHAWSRALELQRVLRQILEENCRATGSPPDPGDDDGPGHPGGPTAPAAAEGTNAAGAGSVTYEKIPRAERPAHRIINAHQPDARRTVRPPYTVIKGYKTQSLCTADGVILDTLVIPASELDQTAMYGMVKTIQVWSGLTPSALVGDTSYGYGLQREQLDTLGIPAVAPVAPPRGKAGKYDATHFRYDREADVYRCPDGAHTVRKTRVADSEGTRYTFPKDRCAACSLREACTDSRGGRQVFHSDHYERYEQARAFNQTEEGRRLLRQRYTVERKNQELKNHVGLGRPRAKSQDKVQIQATFAAIVVNVKYVLRVCLAPKPGFLRRVRPV